MLASFKTDAGFFDTLTLTNPKPLNVPDANNDLERELELCVPCFSLSGNTEREQCPRVFAWSSTRDCHRFSRVSYPS